MTVKLALGLALNAVASVIWFLSATGMMPFMPFVGPSMEPTLHHGSLIMIQPALISEIKVGDVVVFNVPSAVRERYGYPAVVAHRVTMIETEPGPVFHTKGDNAGDDPFITMPWDLRGKVSRQILFAGLPMLLFQGLRGAILIIALFSLLAFFLYREELGTVARKLRRRVAGLTFRKPRNDQLTDRIEAMERTMNAIRQEVDRLVAAMELSQHIESRTHETHGQSHASLEQNEAVPGRLRVLTLLSHNAEKPKRDAEETISKVA
ncbi:MAG: signal peptidase I [Chloroflexi bacterium]|nr:signal peptidase I [Chloroflexota bacterium]